LKTTIAALAGASLLTLAMPAAAQHHGGDGWSHGGVSGTGGRSASGGGSPRGGVPHGGYAGGHFYGGPGFRNFHDRSFGYAGLGLGFALGLSFYDPWYYDEPYYGYYAPYPPPPNYYDGYPPPGAGAAPPPVAAAPPPAACGSWSWDAAKQAYNWVPC
jgi:hypothetical protein